MTRARFLWIFAAASATVAVAAFLLIEAGRTNNAALLGAGIVAGLAATLGLIVLGRIVFVLERQRGRR